MWYNLWVKFDKSFESSWESMHPCSTSCSWQKFLLQESRCLEGISVGLYAVCFWVPLKALRPPAIKSAFRASCSFSLFSHADGGYPSSGVCICATTGPPLKLLSFASLDGLITNLLFVVILCKFALTPALALGFGNVRFHWTLKPTLPLTFSTDLTRYLIISYTVNPNKLNQLTLNVGTVLRQCK